jgi:pentatricopeptide repeat protein
LYHTTTIGTGLIALLQLQGTKPEVRTYNTIINACNRSGQPEHALKVYERMIADGTQPTATTYTALISAYGKTGKVMSSLRTTYTGVADLRWLEPASTRL